MASIHSLNISLNFKDTAAALAFYKNALGAKESFRLDGPDCVWHAEMTLGDIRVFLSDEAEEWQAFTPATVGGCPTLVSLAVDDCDAAFKQATEAGAEVIMNPQNFFWGERGSVIRDPFGYRWCFSQKIEDVSPEEVKRRARQFAEGGA